MTTWQFARDELDKCFHPFRAAGFELTRASGREQYWSLHEAELAAHFPKEVFFALGRLRLAPLARAGAGAPGAPKA